MPEVALTSGVITRESRLINPKLHLMDIHIVDLLRICCGFAVQLVTFIVIIIIYLFSVITFMVSLVSLLFFFSLCHNW